MCVFKDSCEWPESLITEGPGGHLPDSVSQDARVATWQAGQARLVSPPLRSHAEPAPDHRHVAAAVHGREREAKQHPGNR